MSNQSIDHDHDHNISNTELTKVTKTTNNKINDNVTIIPSNKESLTPKSLDTPSRLTTDEIDSGGGAATTTNTTIEPQELLNNDNKKKLIISCIKSETNPLTINREKQIKEGNALIVQFEECVVVHTVPYWDPCGETYYDYDEDDTPRGP
eukprot:226479_1